MTVEAQLSPVYLLRSYAWALLKENTSMDEEDYNGLVPIVPLGEEPELSQFDKPHIVYGYALDATNPQPAMRSGSMSFAVYSTNFREITKILAVLAEGFGRSDESALDINNYTTRYPSFLGIRFGYVSVGFLEGGTPEETSGGRQSGLINIRFEYYVDYQINTAV